MYQEDRSNTKAVTIRKATFLGKEISHNFSSLRKIETCDITKLSNNDIKSRKNELPKKSKLVETLSENFKECI